MQTALPFHVRTSEKFKFFRDINPLTTNVPYHIETSQLICTANQVTGFYIMGNSGRVKNWNGSTCNCRVRQSWPELILSSKFFLPVQHLLILYTHTVLIHIHTQTIFCNEIVIIKDYHFRYIKCFTGQTFSCNVLLDLICIFIFIYIFCRFGLVSPKS